MHIRVAYVGQRDEREREPIWDFGSSSSSSVASFYAPGSGLEEHAFYGCFDQVWDDVIEFYNFELFEPFRVYFS